MVVNKPHLGIKHPYPYGKSLYFIFPARKSPAVERFIAFLRSPEG